MLNWFVGAFAASFAAVVFIDVAGAQAGWDWTYASNPQFASWGASRGWPNVVPGTARGFQFYAPVGISGTNTSISPNWTFDVSAHGGYVYGSQNVGGFSGWVSTATDTTMGATATYTGFNGWQPFFTLLTNLPTGELQLVGNHSWGSQDPDLVPIAVYGEGFNVGPTVGVTIPINAELAVVVSSGYTTRGRYWKENFYVVPSSTTAPALDIKPGDVWTQSATVVWAHDRLTLQATGAFAMETANYVNNAIAYRNGSRSTLSSTANYEWNARWTTAVSGYFTHISKNDIPSIFVPGLLVEEPFNSNNNIFKISVAQPYNTDYGNGTLSLGPLGGFFYRARNSWDPSFGFFVPAKTIYSFGGSAAYTPNAPYTLSATLQKMWFNQDAQPVPGVPRFSGDGWRAMLAVTHNTQ